MTIKTPTIVIGVVIAAIGVGAWWFMQNGQQPKANINTASPGQNQNTAPASSNGNTNQSIGPYQSNQTNFTFSHKIGTSPCPTKIGSLSIFSENAYASDTWHVVYIGGIPKWLNYDQMPNSLPVNGAGVQFDFTCRLDTYETQTVRAELEVVIVSKDGQVRQRIPITITGQITK